jgi:hypothetical protein
MADPQIDVGIGRYAISRGGPDLFGPDGKPSLSASTDAPVITDEAAIAAPARSESRPAAASKPEAAPADTAAVDHDARIAEAERQLAALQSAPPPATAPAAVEPGPKPRRFDFDDPDAYETALVSWAAASAAHRTMAERDKQSGEKAITERQAAANQAVFDLYAARKEKFAASHPDYVEVAEAPDVTITEAMVLAIVHMGETGPSVAYHLGKNKTEARRIAALPPGSVALELGKISARLEAGEPERRTRTVPTTTPRARATTAARPARETSQEYMDRRLQELRAERRPGMFGGGR